MFWGHYSSPTCGFHKAHENMFLALAVPSVDILTGLSSVKSRPVSFLSFYCFSPLFWVYTPCDVCILGSSMPCFCGERHLWFWLRVLFQLDSLSCSDAWLSLQQVSSLEVSCPAYLQWNIIIEPFTCLWPNKYPFLERTGFNQRDQIRYFHLEEPDSDKRKSQSRACWVLWAKLVWSD